MGYLIYLRPSSRKHFIRVSTRDVYFAQMTSSPNDTNSYSTEKNVPKLFMMEALTKINEIGQV